MALQKSALTTRKSASRFGDVGSCKEAVMTVNISQPDPPKRRQGSRSRRREPLDSGEPVRPHRGSSKVHRMGEKT